MREYRPADFAGLWRIDQQCFEEGISYSQAELSAYIRHRRAFTMVAEDAATARPVAFVVAHLARGIGRIITIDIVADYRRTGLGTRLMRAAEERLLADKAQVVILEVAVNNLPAIQFYERLGYKVVRTIPRYYLDSLDALQMAKRLS